MCAFGCRWLADSNPGRCFFDGALAPVTLARGHQLAIRPSPADYLQTSKSHRPGRASPQSFDSQTGRLRANRRIQHQQSQSSVAVLTGRAPWNSQNVSAKGPQKASQSKAGKRSVILGIVRQRKCVLTQTRARRQSAWRQEIQCKAAMRRLG